MNNQKKTIKDLQSFCDRLAAELQEHLCPEFSIPATTTIKEYFEYRRTIKVDE